MKMFRDMLLVTLALVISGNSDKDAARFRGFSKYKYTKDRCYIVPQQPKESM